MKNTQKIQNKRTQVNVERHNTDTFPAEVVRQFDNENIKMILEISINCHLPLWLGFPGSASKITNEKKAR